MKNNNSEIEELKAKNIELITQLKECNEKKEKLINAISISMRTTDIYKFLFEKCNATK